jgi:hypothetical protein
VSLHLYHLVNGETIDSREISELKELYLFQIGEEFYSLAFFLAGDRHWFRLHLLIFLLLE